MTEALNTYILTLEIEPMLVDTAYAALPMHCTIMPRFLSTLTPDQLVSELASEFVNQSPLQLVPGKHQAFGPKRQLVTLLKMTPEILALHTRLHKKLNNLGVKYTEADWVGEGYIPHVTDKQGVRLDPSANFITRAVYLVLIDHPLQGKQRTVCRQFLLSN